MTSCDTSRRPQNLPATVRRPAVASWSTVRARLARGGRRTTALVDRTPLRVRLVVAMLALVALAQVVTGVAALAALDRYLTARLDGQLVAAAHSTAQQIGRSGRLDTRDLVRLDLPGTVYARLSGPGGADAVGLSTADPSTADPSTADRRAPALPSTSAFDAPATVSGSDGQGRWRMVIEPVPGTDAELTMAVTLDEQSAVERGLAVIDYVVSGIVLVLLGGLGYLLVRASLRPLRQVETVAAAIADGRLDERVPERDPRTEVGSLGRSLNAMLVRIEEAFRDRAASEAQARASEQRMRRFIADASHELRTPLTSIRGFAELYRQGAATDAADVSRFMRRIEIESSRMGLLVDDLLLLARLDQRRPLVYGPVDLAALAADAVREARALAPDRPVELRTSGACTVDGDEPRLRQVVSNLVANALVHTPTGTPVTVTVAPHSPAPETTAVLLEVADRGPGMAPEHAARAFERFYRADASRTRQTGGNGLGLAVVAAVVAAHGGTVDVKTAPGRGAAFRVRLPATTRPARGAAGDQSTATVAWGATSSRGVTVDRHAPPREGGDGVRRRRRGLPEVDQRPVGR